MLASIFLTISVMLPQVLENHEAPAMSVLFGRERHPKGLPVRAYFGYRYRRLVGKDSYKDASQ